MKPDDRLICCLVKPLAAGASFGSWPPHITIVPWFRVNVDSNRLINELPLDRFLPFRVTLGSEARLGANKPATLIKLPSELTEIESETSVYLHDIGAWCADETTKKARNFLPHITWQNGVKPVEDFSITEIQIVQQAGDNKVIVATWHNDYEK